MCWILNKTSLDCSGLLLEEIVSCIIVSINYALDLKWNFGGGTNERTLSTVRWHLCNCYIRRLTFDWTIWGQRSDDNTIPTQLSRIHFVVGHRDQQRGIWDMSPGLVQCTMINITRRGRTDLDITRRLSCINRFDLNTNNSFETFSDGLRRMVV